MRISDGYTLIHHGVVVSIGSGEAFVRVDVGAAGRSCAGCALMASCGQGGKEAREDMVVLRARVPSGTAVPEVGASVSVGLPKGNSLQATLLMLVFPLAVFIVLAVIGTVMDYSDGAVALTALLGAVLCYFIVYLCYRRRRSPWVLISDSKI